MNVILGRSTKHLIEDGPHQHTWSEVRCQPGCPNEGPWLIYGPANNERYVCSKCGQDMTVTDAQAS
jgi:hypothetical protein